MNNISNLNVIRSFFAIARYPDRTYEADMQSEITTESKE